MSSLHIILFFLVILCLSNVVASADEIKYRGENTTIKCPAPAEDALGVYLYSRREIRREVLYYHFGKKKLTVLKDFENRVRVENGPTPTIDIFNLQSADTGAYWCTCTNIDGKCKMDESGVFLLVREPPLSLASSTSPSSKSIGMNTLLIPVVALTVGSVLLLALLGLGVCLLPKIKKLLRNNEEIEEDKRSNNGVYEVMTVKRRT